MGFTKFKLLPEKIGLGATKSYFPFYDNEKDADFRVRLDVLVDLIASQVVSAEKAVFELSGITNSGNNYSSTYALATYVTEGIYIFQPNVDSSGDSTLNIPSTGSGSLPIKKFDGTSLVNVADLKAVNTYLLVNKTTYWLLAGGLAGGSGSGTSITDTIVAGESEAENHLVYLKNDGKYWKADYTTVDTCSTELRLVTDATIAANATGQALSIGLKGGFSGLTIGEIYYVGATGNICLYGDIPDVEGIVVRSVGTAKSTTELEFNPDETYIETTLISPTIPTTNAVVIELVATSDIAAYKAVDATGNESNSANTGTRNKCIGISKAAILSGFSGDIVTSGDISNGSWSFSSGNVIYLNSNTLSTTAPISGFSQIIGVAKSSTVITVDIKQAILI